MSISRMLAAILAAVSFSMPMHAVAQSPSGSDELRSVLLEIMNETGSIEIYTNGVTVNAVVVSVDDKYVVAKSQQSSRIVIRLDRIDGVSAFFSRLAASWPTSLTRRPANATAIPSSRYCASGSPIAGACSRSAAERGSTRCTSPQT